MKRDFGESGRLRAPAADAGLLSSITPVFQPHRTTQIRSPYEVNETLWQAMPAEARRRVGDSMFRARTFEPADRREFKADPRSFGVTVAVVHFSGTRISASALRRSMAMNVAEPGVGSYTFGLRKRGTLSIAGSEGAGHGTWGVGTGVLYREREGMRVITSDNHAGLAFELPYARITAILQGLLERPVTRELVFKPSFSFETEPGASVARVVAYIEQELSIPGSLLATGSGAQAIEDLLIRTLLTAQGHNYSDWLQRAPGSGAPYHVQRVEEYMRMHAHEPLNLEQLAATAGCGLRSLQMAFRKYRGRTPLEALRRLRLEQAHREIMDRGAGQSIIEIATKYHFSNLGRFADQYRALFGYLPSQTPRRF